MDEGEEEGEVLAADTSQLSLHLDTLIGHIEDIILGDEFFKLREGFLHDHCQLFEDQEENKLEYMEVYQEYLQVIEGHLESELERRAPELQISTLLQTLSSSSSSSSGCEGEVFELLLTLSDFSAFKRDMLEMKKSEENDTTQLTDLLQVTSLK
ncbi:hypothetical protein O3P69_019282 [Scylla paramamosain]|uniref:ADP-ribosylation factor-like protein 2-binding protein n=1 Tax=Scylla paramamosain TaxID=85552 RepID=A0AAW0SX23_SCYPA